MANKLKSSSQIRGFEDTQHHLMTTSSGHYLLIDTES